MFLRNISLEEILTFMTEDTLKMPVVGGGLDSQNLPSFLLLGSKTYKKVDLEIIYYFSKRFPKM